MVEQIRQFFRLIKPGLLLASALVYIMGTGIAHYLGANINWDLYWQGQAWIILVQISKQVLNSYFEHGLNPSGYPKKTPAEEDAAENARLSRLAVLAIAAVCLTVAASLTLGILQNTQFNSVVLLILLTGFLEAFFYSTPPIQLSVNGYGELSTAIAGTFLTAGLSLMLQFGHLHRLLAMTAFPLAALYIVMLLVAEFPNYAADVKNRKNRLIVRMGWERALSLHNILIVSAFGLLGAALLFGLPFAIGGPAMLALPIGGLQIWLMINLAQGGKPNWRLLVFSSASLYWVCAYLLTFALWTH